jgi:hypothetical protein
VAVVLLAQVAAMRVLFRDPKGKAPWYNGPASSLYVTGMMITAFAVRGLGCGRMTLSGCRSSGWVLCRWRWGRSWC